MGGKVWLPQWAYPRSTLPQDQEHGSIARADHRRGFRRNDTIRMARLHYRIQDRPGGDHAIQIVRADNGDKALHQFTIRQSSQLSHLKDLAMPVSVITGITTRIVPTARIFQLSRDIWISLCISLLLGMSPRRMLKEPTIAKIPPIIPKPPRINGSIKVLTTGLARIKHQR